MGTGNKNARLQQSTARAFLGMVLHQSQLHVCFQPQLFDAQNLELYPWSLHSTKDARQGAHSDLAKKALARNKSTIDKVNGNQYVQ